MEGDGFIKIKLINLILYHFLLNHKYKKQTLGQMNIRIKYKNATLTWFIIPKHWSFVAQNNVYNQTQAKIVYFKKEDWTNSNNKRQIIFIFLLLTKRSWLKQKRKLPCACMHVCVHACVHECMHVQSKNESDQKRPFWSG